MTSSLTLGQRGECGRRGSDSRRRVPNHLDILHGESLPGYLQRSLSSARYPDVSPARGRSPREGDVSVPRTMNLLAGAYQPGKDLAPMSLDTLITEAANPRTTALDAMPVAQMLAIINDDDRTVADAVRTALPDITRAVEVISAVLRGGGRLIYLGAGSSGRIGLLDAVECPPTFGTNPAMVVGVLAGGPGAFVNAVEDVQDDPHVAVADLRALMLGNGDVVVGLSASGRTPYVIGGLDFARSVGAATVSVACNRAAECSTHADVAIEIETGREVLAGSTRLKAGTAQKLVCNMLSTAVMVRIGKVYGNLMVDVQPTNAKLIARARRIVTAATGAEPATAISALEAAGSEAKTAIVFIFQDCYAAQARQRLNAAQGSVRGALETGAHAPEQAHWAGGKRS